jgi:hypothetical protein
VDDHLSLIHFVPFIPHHLCSSSAESWFIRTLRDIAVPANHFFASFDSNGPSRVLRIPGDLDLFCPHDILQIFCALYRLDCDEVVKAPFLGLRNCIAILFF